MVRQGQCFLVSLTLTALAFWTVFRALDRFSGVTSRQISLSSEDTPSIWYSSKKLACARKDGIRVIYYGPDHLRLVPEFIFLAAGSRSVALTCDSSHHMLTPPLATLPDRTKNRLSGVSRRTHIFVSFEMVVTTPGEKDQRCEPGEIFNQSHSVSFNNSLLQSDLWSALLKNLIVINTLKTINLQLILQLLKTK